MNQQTTPPFAGQRIIFLALLIGMTMYAIAAAVILQVNEGNGLANPPVEILDSVVLFVGGAAAIGSFVMRATLNGRAERLEGNQREQGRFIARLVPIVMLEGACLLAITAWLLNGNAVPNLVAALVLLSLAIALVPLQDPDTATR